MHLPSRCDTGFLPSRGSTACQHRPTGQRQCAASLVRPCTSLHLVTQASAPLEAQPASIVQCQVSGPHCTVHFLIRVSKHLPAGSRPKPVWRSAEPPAVTSAITNLSTKLRMAWVLPAFTDVVLIPLLFRLCAACSKRDNPERHFRASDVSPGNRRNHCHSCDQLHQQHPGLHCSLSCRFRRQRHQHPACLSVCWLCTCWTAGEPPARCSAGLHWHGCCDQVQQAGPLLH